MLQITIPDAELFDEKTQRFITIKGQTLQLEHSLVSISKWESKWKKAFLDQQALTPEETRSYVRCMTITQHVDPNVYQYLTNENIAEVMAYIDDKMTATTIKEIEGRSRARRASITSELIYYYMTAYNIPFDPCQKWHLNRLMMLIKVCDEKNAPQKKMSRRQSASQYSKLNAARRARMGTRG